METESQILLGRLKAGDEDAATEIFERYVKRLVGLAGARLSSGLNQRVEPEDVAMSALRTVFVGIREGKYIVQRSGEMWALLAQITKNKVLRQVEHHQYQKRDYRKTRAIDSPSDSIRANIEFYAEEPDDADALAVIDELKAVLNGLEARQSKILEMRLVGKSIAEISKEIGYCERTVRRQLDSLQEVLESRLLEAE